MANATKKVDKAITSPLEHDWFRHSYKTTTVETTLYTGAMIGLNTGGYLAKFDDTVSLRFAGVVRGREGNPVLPIGTEGDGTIDLDVAKPRFIELAIASIAITDIGRRVYAVDDQTGTLDASTRTYANYVGVVAALVYAMDGGSAVSGIALVECDYGWRNGEQLQIMGASGAVVIKPSTVLITKAGVAALTIGDPTTGVHDGMVMTFISTTASAHTLDNSAGSGFNAGGAGSDIGTFGGAKGDGISIIAYAGDWYVLDKTNVTLA